MALPDRVWLTEVVYNPAGTQVRGNAPTNNLLADYLARLGESPSLADVSLRGSSLKTVRGRERVEFLLQASARGAGAATSSAGDLPARQDPSEMLRQLQSLALESGLQMTKFALPGVAVDSEFTGELAATIELAGSTAHVESYTLARHKVRRDGRLVLETFGGRYLDRFEKRGGEWRILHRQVVHDWSKLEPIAAEYPNEAFESGQRSRADASYRR